MKEIFKSLITPKQAVALTLFFALEVFLSLLASYNLHYVLSREADKITYHPLALLRGLEVPQIRSFFLLFLLMGVMFIGYIVFTSNNVKYKSDMQKITPNIITPKAEGQVQYGSATWLCEKQKDKVFDIARITLSDKRICKLMEKRMEDLGEEQEEAKKSLGEQD